MSMVKALTQIISVEKQDYLISMSIVEKENESGLKYNQRLFVVKHGYFFGYLSQAKMTQDPQAVDLNKVKQQIPMKNLHSLQVQDNLLKMTFVFMSEDMLVPKQWILKMNSTKMANDWKSLLDYEIQILKKSDKRNQAGRKKGEPAPSLSQLRQSSSGYGMKNVGQADNEARNQEVVNSFFLDDAEQDQEAKNHKKDKKSSKQVRSIERNYRFQDSGNTASNSKQANQSQKKIQKTAEKDLGSSRMSSSAQKTRDINGSPLKSSSEEIKSTKTKGLKLNIPAQGQISAQNNQPPLDRSKNQGKPRSFALPQISQEDSQSQIPQVQNQAQKNKELARKSSRGSLAKSVSKSEMVRSTEALEQQMNEIAASLQEKNKKNPIRQLTYDHYQTMQLIKLHEKEVTRDLKQPKKIQMMLTKIMETQKYKLQIQMKEKSSINLNSWFYLQVQNQVKSLLLFQQYCQTSLVQLHHQLLNRTPPSFKKQSEKDSILTFRKGQVQLKIALISQMKDSKTHLNSLSRQAEVQLRRQFKSYQYLYQLTSSSSRIKVPLHCFCEYAGLKGLFRVIPQCISQQFYNTRFQDQLKKMQADSKLPLTKVLANKIKRLNAFHYNQMRSGQASLNFDYDVIEEISHIFVPNLSRTAKQETLRMQLIKNEVGDILPHLNNQKIDSNSNQLAFVKTLSNKMDHNINTLASMMDNLQFVHNSPDELNRQMHSMGINTSSIGLVYNRITNPYVKSILYSQMIARTLKTLLDYRFQKELFKSQKGQTKIAVIQGRSAITQGRIVEKMAQTIRLKTISFLNEQLKLNISKIKQNCTEHFGINQDYKNTINNGYLLISIAYHCSLNINWKDIQTKPPPYLQTKISEQPFFIVDSQVISVQPQVQSFIPNSLVQAHILANKLAQVSRQNFIWIIDTLELKKHKFPQYLKLYTQLGRDLRVYLVNFIQPDQNDFSDSYAHLALTDTNQPTAANLKIEFKIIQKYLNRNQKSKYLPKFNQLHNKLTRLYGSNNPFISELYQLFAQCQASKMRIEDAVTFMKSTILNLTALQAHHSTRIIQAYNCLATMLITHQRQSEALEYLQKSQQVVAIKRIEDKLMRGTISKELALIYFKKQNYQQSKRQAELALACYQHFQQSADSYQQERVSCYELAYCCNLKLKDSPANTQLCLSLKKKIRLFTTHASLRCVLTIIVQVSQQSLLPQNHRAFQSIVNMIPMKRSIAFYQQAYSLIMRRMNQENLLSLLQMYLNSSHKILEVVIANKALQQWRTLNQVYERESLFDFISLFEELLYFLGKDLLLSTTQ